MTRLIGELPVFLIALELTVYEVVREIVFTHDLVGGQFLGQSLKEDTSFKEQVGTVGDRQRLLHVMVGDEDADVAVLQSPHDMLDVLHGNRVDTGKWLVEHDELRVDGQATGYLRTTALTTRQTVTLVLAHLLQAELGDKALQLVQLFAGG